MWPFPPFAPNGATPDRDTGRFEICDPKAHAPGAGGAWIKPAAGAAQEAGSRPNQPPIPEPPREVDRGTARLSAHATINNQDEFRGASGCPVHYLKAIDG